MSETSKEIVAKSVVHDLYEAGHGRGATVMRIAALSGITIAEAEELVSMALGLSPSPPRANCHQCKYNTLPHDGGYCYMFSEPPGKRCRYFTKND